MAHRTQPPSRDEIAEQTIDFIEGLGFPLVPWQAEMLRAMLKHDGPVQVAPQPRKHPRRCGAELDGKPGALPHRCNLTEHLGTVDGLTVHMCSCGHPWIGPKPQQPQCLCTMGYSNHCPVHGQSTMLGASSRPPRPGMVRVLRDGKWTWSDLFDDQDN